MNTEAERIISIVNKEIEEVESELASLEEAEDCGLGYDAEEEVQERYAQKERCEDAIRLLTKVRNAILE